MDKNEKETPLFERIYAMVRQVPPGKVVTYGQVARMVGGCSAQMIGFALAALKEREGVVEVPWQRVINAKGKISPHGYGVGSEIQRQLLIGEGVEFNEMGCIDFDRFGWVEI